MTKHLVLLAIGILSLNLAVAQPASLPDAVSERPVTKAVGDYVAASTNSLLRFDLDFPGGTPNDLVKAIVKATGKPLNTVIPEDCAHLKIPALSVKNVTVAQLFEVLKQASKEAVSLLVQIPDGAGSYQGYTNSYGFRTEGVPAPNSIWYFYWDRYTGFRTAPFRICKFYQLSPYLEAGYKVEDITTALSTSCKMLGDAPPPDLTYHKDTKVLIAVGDSDKVKLIDDVLKELKIAKRNDPPVDKAKGQ